jgi:Tfp pilus assembly protein PilF
VALAARTFIRNPDWASTQSLLQSAVRDHPESYRSQWTIAASYSHDGDDRRAALHFEAAYRTYSRDSEFLAEYGNFWLGQRRWQQGVDLLETAYEMHPFVLRSTTLLGYGYLGVGRFEDALRLIQRAEELRGALAVTMPMRAYAFERLNDPDRAAAAWRVAVQQPGTASWLSWSFLARTLAMGGHDEAAREALRSARSVVPAEGRAILARLESAVSTGCYHNAARGSAASRRRPDGSQSALPACDSLGDWLDYAVVQSASSSQNATTRPTAAPGARESSTQ